MLTSAQPNRRTPPPVTYRCDAASYFLPRCNFLVQPAGSRVSGRTRFVASTLSLPTHAPPPHFTNSALMDRFPCGMCRLQAYCCCPCTLGLSLLSVIRQAKEVERGEGTREPKQCSRFMSFAQGWRGGARRMCIHICILCTGMYFPTRTRQICRNEKNVMLWNPLSGPSFWTPGTWPPSMCVPPVTNNVLRAATEQTLGLTRV